MKHSIFFWIGLVFMLFPIAPLQATHIIGGDLTYECTADYKYRFTLTVYSECGSAAVLENFYPVRYFAPSLNLTANDAPYFYVYKSKEEEVPIFCQSQRTNCEGGSQRGIKKVIYKGEVDLSAYGPAADWEIFWQRAARSEEISSLMAPSAEDFFISVRMDNKAAACNNSPVFGNSPVIFSCLGEDKNYNQNTLDRDKDQLVYSFSAPRTSTENTVTFDEGYNEVNFMMLDSSARLDSLTGDLSFMPMAQMVGITDITVDEYRNGQWIGSVSRGLQITSFDCTNRPPELSPFLPDSTYRQTFCAGDEINLKIKATDSDTEDRLRIRLLNGKSGVFSVENNFTTSPSGHFEWKTSPADSGEYRFTIQVEDDGCPKTQSYSRTFVLEILSTPAFELGNDTIIGCNDQIWLKPDVNFGTPPYDFKWSNEEAEDSILVSPGTYTLQVTDQNGCTASDTIHVISELLADFSFSPRCLGDSTYFKDLSTDLGGTITSWKWEFGDGNSSELQNPVHVFEAAGTYLVKLEVSDDQGCVEDMQKSLLVCAAPTVSYTYADSCQQSLLTFTDTTPFDEGCKITKRTWDWGDGNQSVGASPKAYHTYEEPGTFTLSLTVETEAGCISTTSREFEVYERPLVNIQEEDFYLKCDQADTVLHGEILNAPHQIQEVRWSNNDSSLNTTINSSGVYIFTVWDKLGCEHSDTVRVSFPLQADFNFTPMCEPGDPIRFTDQTQANAGEIISWQWDFGDGNTSTLQHPVHTYSTLGDYTTTLTVTDEDSCTSTVSLPVYYTYYDASTFDVIPDSVTICVNDPVYGIPPTEDAMHGSHLDSFYWEAESSKVSISNPNKGFTIFRFQEIGTYPITLHMTYNRLDSVNQGCQAIFRDTVRVFPELKVELDASRVCVGDTTYFSFRRTAGDLNIAIDSAVWEIQNLKTKASITYTTFDPKHVFTTREKYLISLWVQDEVGCRYQTNTIYFADKVAQPDFETGTFCLGDTSVLKADFQDVYENITDYEFIINGDTNRGPYTRPFEIKTVFQQAGTFPATLTVFNSFTGCEESITKEVTILHHPKPAFEAEKVCFGRPTIFNNLSAIEQGKITAYYWDFGDGNYSEDQHPDYIFKTDGRHTVSLTAFNEKGCAKTYSGSVFVEEKPEAEFFINNKVLEANIPLYFEEDALGDVISYHWNFGDGQTSSEPNPTHTYTAIDSFEITLSVQNSFGCTDTLRRFIDLNAYLELPTAFTPNNDGLNDRLELIHYGIKTLEFKLFNRWGQLVFETTDPTKSWDGLLNGKRQAEGVYIAHVKAIGANSKSFNFSKKVSLIY